MFYSSIRWSFVMNDVFVKYILSAFFGNLTHTLKQKNNIAWSVRITINLILVK